VEKIPEVFLIFPEFIENFAAILTFRLEKHLIMVYTLIVGICFFYHYSWFKKDVIIAQEIFKNKCCKWI